MIATCPCEVEMVLPADDFEGQSLAVVQAFVHVAVVNRYHKKVLDGIIEYPDVPESLSSGPEIVNCIVQLVDEFEKRCQGAGFQTQVKSMGLTEKGALDTKQLLISYAEVLDSLFCTVNWGRVIAMFAFLRMMVYHLLDHHEPGTIRELIHCTTSVIERRLRFFISSKGGWLGLLSFKSSGDDVLDVKQTLLRGLGGIASVAGVAAIVGFIASRL
ncbi:Bcl-2-like protein 1 [Sparganum proliferum]